jgi:putative transposase
VDVLVSQSTSVSDAIRQIDVSDVTYFRWHRESGNLKSDQVKRSKDRETENARLRKAISDLTLDKQIAIRSSRRIAHGVGRLGPPAIAPTCISVRMTGWRADPRRATSPP